MKLSWMNENRTYYYALMIVWFVSSIGYIGYTFLLALQYDMDMSMLIIRSPQIAVGLLISFMQCVQLLLLFYLHREHEYSALSWYMSGTMIQQLVVGNYIGAILAGLYTWKLGLPTKNRIFTNKLFMVLSVLLIVLTLLIIYIRLNIAQLG